MGMILATSLWSENKEELFESAIFSVASLLEFANSWCDPMRVVLFFLISLETASESKVYTSNDILISLNFRILNRFKCCSRPLFLSNGEIKLVND